MRTGRLRPAEALRFARYGRRLHCISVLPLCLKQRPWLNNSTSCILLKHYQQHCIALKKADRNEMTPLGQCQHLRSASSSDAPSVHLKEVQELGLTTHSRARTKVFNLRDRQLEGGACPPRLVAEPISGNPIAYTTKHRVQHHPRL